MKILKAPFLLLCSILLPIFFFSVQAQDNPNNPQNDNSKITNTIIKEKIDETVTGVLSGTILNGSTQSPIGGATIIVNGTKIGTRSNAQGKFTLRSIPVGIISIKVSAIGFESRTLSDIAISSGKPSTITALLSESVVRLEETEVEASYFQRSPETITSTQLLNSEDVRRAPGVQEDVIRAVALLPGVNVTSAGRNDLIVRGGAPFENLFVVDNIEVPNINHFGSQGSTGGPLSLINIDFVREVSFSAGGFSSRFGDRVSSLTNISLREGNEERFGGEVNFSATGFGIIAEGPISDKGSYFVSARRSYLDLLFKALGFSFIPDYWDFQTKISYRLDENNSLSFLTIGALDKVTFNNDDEEDRYSNSRINSPSQDQYFSGLTWKHLITGSGMNGYALFTLGRTYSAFNTAQRDSTLATLFNNSSKEGENSLRTDLFLQLSPGTEIIVGNIVKYASLLDYDLFLDPRFRRNLEGKPTGLSVDSSFTAFRNATHATLVLNSDAWKATIGMRLDYFDFLVETTYLSPRMTLSYALNPVSTINLSIGRYYQSPSFIWLMGDPSNQQQLKAIRADQIVLGYELQLAADLKFQIEGYYKWYGNYAARAFRPQAVLAPAGFDDVQNDIPFGLEPLISSSKGFARGIEAFIQKKMGEIPLYGLMSVTINESRFSGLDGIERAGAFDARVIFNIAAGYRFNENWEISAKFRYSTGAPSTPFIEDPNSPQYGQLNFAEYNAGERLPDFHAMDFRLDRRWNFEGFLLITYIDIQNLYNRKNANNFRFDQRLRKGVVNFAGAGILPSIGLNVEF
ncbi:MAG: TonB-dependent receptor [Candidatus Kapaibacteriota bacterium]